MEQQLDLNLSNARLVLKTDLEALSVKKQFSVTVKKISTIGIFQQCLFLFAKMSASHFTFYFVLQLN